MTDAARTILRIDCFTVPGTVRGEFLRRVNATHAVLRGQPGFVFDRIVERPVDDGASRLITIVEWSGPDAIAGAVRAVKEAHRGDGFSAADFIAANGIVADLGTFRPVA